MSLGKPRHRIWRRSLTSICAIWNAIALWLLIDAGGLPSLASRQHSSIEAKSSGSPASPDRSANPKLRRPQRGPARALVAEEIRIPVGLITGVRPNTISTFTLQITDRFAEILALTSEERSAMDQMIRMTRVEWQAIDARNAEYVEKSDVRQVVRLPAVPSESMDKFKGSVQQLLGESRAAVAAVSLFNESAELGRFTGHREISLILEGNTWHLIENRAHPDWSFQGGSKTPLKDSFQVKRARDSYGHILKFNGVNHE
jgi:hypothetical protein